MAGRIPDSFIDELLSRVDIVEIIEARVPLKRQGREYSARCPFHDERSPSFTVSPVKQFYHCFGCGAHGSAIKFLMDYDRLEFLDAVEELAQRAGLTVPREAKAAPSPEFGGLYEALGAAADFFARQLKLSDAARAYVERRGIDAASVRRFGIGYAPQAWDALKNALGGDPAKLKAVERAGLLSVKDDGHSYDKFRHRLMFPILDRRGRVIAFGGRVIDPDDSPKYLNSPETALFHKGRELYGLYQARQANSKLARLIVVEGYMDVLMLVQHGVSQAVATLGTATTKDHAELLFRNAADVYFCFDGDRAGRAAAWRAVESVLPRMKDGRQAGFLFLPDGEDPDSLIRSEGQAGFEQRLAAATPLSEFFFAEIGKDVNLHSLDGRARLAERARPALATIPDGAFRDLMQQRMSEITGLASGRAPARSAPPPATARVATANRGAPKRTVVRSAIELLVKQPSLVDAIQPPYRFAELRQPGIDLLIELIALSRSRPGLSTTRLLDVFEGREEHSALLRLALMDRPDPTQWQAEFVDALAQLDRQTLQQRVDELSQRRSEGPLSDAETAELREGQRELGRLKSEVRSV